MNPLDRLTEYLRGLERRVRLGALVRGGALICAVALLATLLGVLLANRFAFSSLSVTASRTLLFLAVALALGFGALVPLLVINRRRAARQAEKQCPEFEQRLLTFAEKTDAADPFLELLAADTLEIARHVEPERLVSRGRIAAFASLAIGAAMVLGWLIVAGPGFLGHGASLLWAGAGRQGNQSFYDLLVTPGNHTLRRRTDQLITARALGFQPRKVKLFAKYRSASKWEETPMAPQPRGAGFEFLFAGVSEDLDYYVQADAVRSQSYKLSVIDLPAIKRIRVTYRFPAWLGAKDAVEDPGGDLRAIAGTEADIAVQTDRPLASGALVVDRQNQVRLSHGADNWLNGRLTIEKDGIYHIAALERGESVRLSEDFFIEALQESAPVVRITRPGRDARVNPIEEVPVQVSAQDDFGLHALALHYSVNGGPEQTVPLLPRKGEKEAQGGTTIYLEDFKLVPGDLVSLYASARDARSTTRTDIFFIEAQPFEREYSQSQQMAGQMGGDREEDGGNRISQRQKEIIAATWNQIKDRSSDRAAAAENARFLSDVQAKLRDQAKSLATRMGRRELSGANQQFQSFSKDMEQAAEAMSAATDKLRSLKWQEALSPEQRALQHLLRAEATFREIQVAFGSRGAGGRGGGSGRDLENLFDLELDTEKNQYETRQQVASADQRSKEIDEALQKLEQLARRQQELAQQQARNRQTFEQRWQQEMLRREAEQLQRQMEQLTREGGSQSSSQQGSQSASASQQSSQSSRLRAMAGGSSARQSAPDPRLRRALDRLDEATRDMRRAAGQNNEQSAAEARRAAERLDEARNLLNGLRREEASGQMSDLAGRADKLAGAQRDFESRLRQAYGQQSGSGQPQPDQNRERAAQFAQEKERMAEELERLERDMARAAREMASSQPSAASRLRQALGEMQQEELRLRMKFGAEWLRRGYGALMVPREAPVTQGLERAREAVREAQNAMGRAPQGQNNLERALERVEALRRQVEQMTQDRGQAGGRGRQQEGAQTDGRGGQQQRGQRGREHSAANFGDLPGPQGPVPQVAPENRASPRAYREGVRELRELRTLFAEDPALAREVQELIRQAQRLDPSRFPGNPELLERMRTEVLPNLEQLELQLRRKLDEQQGGQVRSGAPEPVPHGYAEAVAEYFRRLSKTR